MNLTQTESKILYILFRGEYKNPLAGASLKMICDDAYEVHNSKLVNKTVQRNLRSLIQKELISEGSKLSGGRKTYYILDSGISLVEDALECKKQRTKGE